MNVFRVSDHHGTVEARRPEAVAGMRRIDFLRIAVVDGRTSCEAVGMGHRLPSVRHVPLTTAIALAKAGVPAVIRSRPGHVSTSLFAGPRGPALRRR
jgi:hypothetical protein